MFARPSRSLAAVLATATVALAIGAGPLAGAARAAVAGCEVSTTGHLNEGSDVPIALSADPGELAPTDKVKLVSLDSRVAPLAESTAPDPERFNPTTFSITSKFNLAAAAPALYDVTVYDSQNALKGICTTTGSGGHYSIVGGAPTVTGFSKPARGKSTTTTLVTITGTNLAKHANVEFLTGGTVTNGIVTGGTVDNDVTWAEGTATTATSMSGTLTVGPAATPGQHILRFTNTDGQTWALANALNVSNAPTITSLDWTGLAIGASNRSVVVTGTDFQPGLTNSSVAFYTNGGSTTTANTTDITINSTTYNSPTQFTLNVSIPSGATAGTKLDLKVTNPDAGTVTKANAMTINAKPTVTDVVPRGRDAGATGQVLAVTGTGFVATLPQTVFTFDNGVTVTASNVTSATSATITVDIAPSAATAARIITATNADGGVGTCTGNISTPKCFSVTTPPTISSISPPTLARGVTSTVTISGNNFNTGTYNSGNVSFGAGITVNSATRVSLTSVTANITIDSGAVQGSRTVTITNPTTDIAGAGTATKSNAFSVSALAVTSASPNSAANTNDRTITINGGGFALGTGGQTPTVTLVPTSTIAAAQSPIVATAVSAVTSSSLSATFPLDAATPGNYDISVVNSTGEAGSCSSCFTIFGGQPTVTSVTPSSRGAGAQNTVLSIVGTNFSHGATVSFPPTSGVTVDGPVNVVDGRNIVVLVDIAGTGTPGVANPTVTTADSQSGTCVGGCFTVTAKPSVATISPNARAIGSAPVTITVTGTGFQTGNTPTLSLGAGVTVSNVAVVNATSITATVAIANNAIPGARDATVTNPDGGSSTTTNAFTVNAAPIITTVSPATIQRGATGVDITISGSNFNTTDTAVTFSGTGLAITQTTRTSANVVVVRVTADTAAPLGARDVTVTNGDGGNVTKTGGLTVLSNPVVTTVAPSTAAQGQTVDLVITGSGYDGTSLVSISGTGITLGTLTRTSSTSLTQRITVASDAATGARDVTVTNGDGGTGTKTGALTINPAPTVSTVSPASGQTRGTPVTETITGANFVNGATVSFGPGITVGTVTVTSPTQISVPVTIANDATPGARTVTVTNPDGGVGSKANGFTVLSNPTLTSVTPAAIGQGATRAVTLTGTGFSGPATVTVSGTGVTVSAVTVVNTTTITATFAATDAATTGVRDVTVTNADGGTVTKTAALAVGAKPTISSISPTSIQRGRVNRSMTITGTNFVAGAVPNLGTGITVNGTPTVTATQITMSVTVGSTAALGARDVSVTNPDQGKAISTGALTVTATRTFVITAPATSKSGDAQTVEVKAVDSDGTTTDTGYTGTPVLTSTDTHFTPGTCAAAVNGVASCTGVKFGDLGTKSLSAAGTGNDADLGGTKSLKVTPVALVFTTAPSTAPRGSSVNFTVAPTAANSGTITGYSEPRTLTTTGGSTPASGTLLSCSSANCTFPVGWETGGSKTVQVSDGSLSTPVVTVTITAPTSLSSGVNKRVVPQRGSITLSGTMLNADTSTPVSGQEIRIYRRVMPASSYSYVTAVTTDANGRYSYTGTGLTRNTFYVARFMGSTSYAPSIAAPRLAYVSAGITASIPTTVTAGRSLTINGRTSPAIPGAKVLLFERLSDGRLLALAITRARADGTFTLVRSSGLSRGFHRLQAYVGGTSLNAGNGTAFVTTRAV